MNQPAETPAEAQAETGFVIDAVRQGGRTQYTWALLDHNGDVLARAGRAYESRQEAQIAIASTRIQARESDVPTSAPSTIR